MRITDEAAQLHKSAIIIDGHSDTMIERDERKLDLDMVPRDENLQADVPRLLEGGFTAINSMCGNVDLQRGLRLLDGIHRMVDDHPDVVLLVDKGSDIETAKAEGKLGIVPQLESCTLFGEDLAGLRMFHRLGLRVANLERGACQMMQSPFEHCSLEDRKAAEKWPGLTDFGREVVPECNRLGIVLDLAHTYDSTFFEAVALSTKPVIFSHGNVFSECGHWRNLTDDQLKALRDCGGVFGMAFYPLFIDEKEPTLERLLDHFDYAIDLIGPDHVGIGSDFDGCGPVTIPGSVTQVVEVTQGLLDRGQSHDTILKVLGGNFLRVYKEVMVSSFP